MKKLILIGLMFCAIQSVFSQDKYIFNQYNINPAIVNPGASGFDGDHNILLMYKSTWASFSGAPQTFAFHYNGPVADRFSIGAQLLSDNFANLNSIRGILNFAYTIDAETYKVGVGLGTEYLQHRLRNIELGSELIDETDELLLDRLDDRSFFEASLGVHALLNERLAIDVALPSVVSAIINGEEISQDSVENFQYILGLGYEFDVQNYDMKIKPSVYVNKFKNIPLHVDINVLMKFLGDKLQSGVSYTLGADNGLGFLIGAKLNNVVFNYSYSVSLNPIQVYNNGGHELSLGLTLGNN